MTYFHAVWEINKPKNDVINMFNNSVEFKKDIESSWAKVDYLGSDFNGIYIYINEDIIQLSENAGVGAFSLICIIQITKKKNNTCSLQMSFRVGILSFRFIIIFLLVCFFLSIIGFFLNFLIAILLLSFSLFTLLSSYFKFLTIKKVLSKIDLLFRSNNNLVIIKNSDISSFKNFIIGMIQRIF